MLLVLSSDRESLSRALLDAMGAGVYGMAGDPGMEDWSGFPFERGSAAYLGGMIRFRLLNPAIRHAAGRAANRRDSQTLSLAEGGTYIAKVYFDRMGWEAVAESTKKPNGCDECRCYEATEDRNERIGQGIKLNFAVGRA